MNGRAGLEHIFASKSDPRIDFFLRYFDRPGDLDLILNLRAYALEGTGFSGLKMSPGSNLVVRPRSVGKYGNETAPERTEHAVSLIIKTALSPEKENRNYGGFSSPLLSKHKQSLHGVSPAALFLVAVFAVFLALLDRARRSDAASMEAVNARILEGICTWVVKGCKSHPLGSGDVYDCYLPRELCQSSGNTSILMFITAVVMIVGCVNILGTMRNKKTSELLRLEFNDTCYDDLLNHLAARQGMSDIDWSKEVRVNSQPWTLRTLMLVVLSSFDDKLYNRAFSEILPAAIGGQALYSTGSGFMGFLEMPGVGPAAGSSVPLASAAMGAGRNSSATYRSAAPQ